MVDIDVAHGKKGQASLDEIERTIGAMPGTLEARTGSGGRHLLFAYPTTHNIRNKQDIRPGIDIRGEGGYIVAPPSIHDETGELYSWPSGDETPILDCPEGVLDMIAPEEPKRPVRRPWDPVPQKTTDTTKDYTTPVGTHPVPANTPVIERASLYLRECESASQGAGGHDALLWAARAMVIGFDLSDGDALSLLWSEYNPRCNPPWLRSKASEVKDFERKVAQAHDTECKKPRGWLLDDYGLRSEDAAKQAFGARLRDELLETWSRPVGEGSTVEITEAAAPVLRASKSFPIHCFPPKIREYIELVADVQVVTQEAVGLAVLVSSGASIGNSYRLRIKKGFDVPPIIWGLIVAETGSNKSGPFREIIKPLRMPVPMELIKNAIVNPQGQLLVEDATTESIIDVQSRSPRGLILANGEAAGWIGAFDRYSQGSNKKVSVDESIWLKEWDCDTYQKNRKTDSENILIHSAACAVVGCIQPSKMRDCVDPSNFASGLVPRILIVTMEPRYRGWSEREMTDEHTKFWHDVIMYLRTLPFDSRNPNTGEFLPTIVTLSPTAKSRYIDEFERIAKTIMESNSVERIFMSKSQGSTGRLALILHGMEAACGMHEMDTEIDVKTMENAITLQQYLLEEQMAAFGIAGQQFNEKLTHELRDFIVEKGGSVTPRQVQRKNGRRWPNKEAASKALDKLVESGAGTWDAARKKFTLNKEK